MVTKQLTVAIEGTTALGPFWLPILSDYLEKIIRCFCSAEPASQIYMDVNCECDSGESCQSSILGFMCDNSLIGSPSRPLISAACSLCGRIISSDNGIGDVDDRICSDCKFLLMEDLESLDVRRRRTPASRRRHHSTESAESMFSEQFSQMISRSRQDHSIFLDPENQSLSSHTTRSSSRRWSVLSDTESDGFGSLYGESESNVSFRRYEDLHGEADTNSYSAIGGDSDASVDEQNFGSFSDRGSDLESDTDIDPMNTGFDEWESEGEVDQIEDDSSLEEDDVDDTLEFSIPGGQLDMSLRSNGNNIFVNWSRQLFPPEHLIRLESVQVHSSGLSNILVDSVTLNHVGDIGDYLESRGFEYLLEHFPETERLRKGELPASASFLSNMPCITINGDNLNDMACAICKDFFTVGTIVNQLPCLHLYHPSCILPWLSARNTCPLCRYELPTYDNEREDRKRRGGSIYRSLHIHQHEANDDSSTYDVSELHLVREQMVLINADSERLNGRTSMSRNRWLLLAAPIVGLAGISLMFWLGGNPSVIRRCPSGNAPFRTNNNNRRWWPFL